MAGTARRTHLRQPLQRGLQLAYPRGRGRRQLAAAAAVRPAAGPAAPAAALPTAAHVAVPRPAGAGAAVRATPAVAAGVPPAAARARAAGARREGCAAARRGVRRVHGGRAAVIAIAALRDAWAER